MTGGRNGHLQLMSVKKEADEKGLPHMNHDQQQSKSISTTSSSPLTLPFNKTTNSNSNSNPTTSCSKGKNVLVNDEQSMDLADEQ
jgi:hypothetical protein